MTARKRQRDEGSVAGKDKRRKNDVMTPDGGHDQPVDGVNGIPTREGSLWSPGRRTRALAEALQDVCAHPASLEEVERSCGGAAVASLRTWAEKTRWFSSDQAPSPRQDTVRVSGVVPPPPLITDGTLPVLPKITDAALERRVFTPQGNLDDSQNHRVDLSYERLEFLGDAYLECICSRIIYARFPNLSAGKLSKVRESLVRNVALAGHARRYGFPDRIQGRQVDEKARVKTDADMFEAYVAAVILQSPETGFATAERWLHQLWTPTLQEWDQRTASLAAVGILPPDSSVHGESAPRHAKKELAVKLFGRQSKVEYVDERPPDLTSQRGSQTFYIGAYFTGLGYLRQHLGSGTGPSKTEAGQRAAVEALTKNRALVEEIAVKKKARDEELARERALEEQQGG